MYGQYKYSSGQDNQLGVISLKEGISFGKNIIGSIFGGRPQWLKDYFDGHWNRHEDRLTRADFFRFAWYKGWFDTPDGKKDIQSTLQKAGLPMGTTADAYLTLFPNNPADIPSLQRGYFDLPSVKNKSSEVITLYDQYGGLKSAPRMPVLPGEKVQAGILPDMDLKMLIPIGIGLFFLMKMGK